MTVHNLYLNSISIRNRNRYFIRGLSYITYTDNIRSDFSPAKIYELIACIAIIATVTFGHQVQIQGPRKATNRELHCALVQRLGYRLLSL